MSQPKDFGFGGEEQMVRDQARKFLDEHCNVEKLRALVAGNPDPDRAPQSLWDESAWNKAVELGWTSLAVPESAGGVGMKMVAVAGLAEQVGRHAFPSPLLPTICATLVLRECKGDAAKKQLEEIAGGASISLAFSNKDGSWRVEDTEVKASGSGASATLDGTASFVQDARKVGTFLVAAKAGKGVGLYVVPAGGATITPDRIVDLTRDQARVSFKGAKAVEVVAPGEAPAAFKKALPGILTVVSADMVGAAEWLLQTAVEYAKVREQFGHPIGFFQAVKHPLVNVMIAIDKAKSLVYNAACAIDTEPETAEMCARMAKAKADEAATFAGDRAVQFHGGIGFTWECDVHMYFKRQRHNQFLYGDAVHHRRALADQMIGPIGS